MHNSIQNLSNNISSNLSVPPHTSKAKDQKLKILLKMDNSAKKTTSPSATKTPLQHPGQGHHRHYLHGPGGPRELQQKDKLHKSQSSLETSRLH